MRIIKTPLLGLACLLCAVVGSAPLPPKPSKVTALSAIVIDAESGKVLWSKDSETPRFPASTTKIMTALLLIEHCTPDEVIVAPPDIEKVKESSLHLKPGERVTAKEMLFALMLRSANDGCVAVAVHISGSVPAFAKLMNERAKEIGCSHTHFNNPNGLNDPVHTVSAHDLALIAREAMKYEWFRDTVRTTKHTIVRSIDQQDLLLKSKNKWLAKDPTADGIKTGYTVPAGHCYVGSATRFGYRLITVVFKSQNWQEDNHAMLDWGFGVHDRTLVKRKGDEVGKILLADGAQTELAVRAEDDVHHLFLKGTEPAVDLKTQALPGLSAPVTEGAKVGTATFSDSTGWSMTVPLLASASVAKAPPPPKPPSASLSYGLIAGSLCLGAYWMRAKARRMKLS